MQAWTCAHTGTHTKAHLQHRHNVHTCTHMDAHICSITTYRHAHTHYIYAHRLSTQIQTSATFTIYGHAHMYMHTHDTHAHSIQTLLYVYTTVLGTLTAIFKHNYTAVLAATYKWGRWAALVIVYKKIHIPMLAPTPTQCNPNDIYQGQGHTAPLPSPFPATVWHP